MTNQIFKKNFPSENLFSFLERVCEKNEKCYIFNNCSYKKAQLTDELNPFLETCKPYYHLSKQKYIDKKMNYNKFMTVLRQICNHNTIKYTSEIKYEYSTYNIYYYFYF